MNELRSQVDFWMCKSIRKNAKKEYTPLFDTGELTKEEYINKICMVLEKVVYNIANFNNNKNIVMYANLYKYKTKRAITTKVYRHYSFEECINFIYNCYGLVNSHLLECLTLEELHNNSNIRYQINKWYHN